MYSALEEGGGKFKETFKERFGIHLLGGCGAGAGKGGFAVFSRGGGGM